MPIWGGMRRWSHFQWAAAWHLTPFAHASGVICRSCESWNLSPLEQRWEAVEECERAYRATPIRVSTDNIGLATVSPMLDLVRVGKPLRPEFAAWRYGSRMRRHRWQRAASASTGALVNGAAMAFGTVAALAGVAARQQAAGSFAMACNSRWNRSKRD